MPAQRTTKAQQRDALKLMFDRYKAPDRKLIKTFRKTWKRDDGSEAGVDLSYLGHADLTMILLTEDPLWNWEPCGIDPTTGVPAVERDPKGYARGLWIRLTVHGHSRIGFGNCPPGKSDAQKILIGNALRNAAMRFGVGLSLWKANTDVLLDAGLNPDDQGVVEGDDEEAGDPEEGAAQEPPEGGSNQRPVDGGSAATPGPAAAAPAPPATPTAPQDSGSCPECYAPAGHGHATKCGRRGALAEAAADHDAADAPRREALAQAAEEAPASDDPWAMSLDAVRVEVAKHLTAMRGDQVQKFIDYRRVHHLPDDLNQATEEAIRGTLSWLRGQPVARVAGTSSG